jgi:lipopolysaccharide assembly protein A
VSMRYVLVLLLIVIFGYALALVLQNSTEVSVDLLFSQVPAMRLGLLLLLTLALGIILGLLLAVQIFRVFQTNWEIKRLRKDIDHLRKEQIHTAQLAAAEAAANVKHEKTVLDIVEEPRNSNPL